MEKDAEIFEKQGNPLPYEARYFSGAKFKEYIIEFPVKALISDIRILFGVTSNKAFRMNLKIYGLNEEKENLLYSNSYDESVY